MTRFAIALVGCLLLTPALAGLDQGLEAFESSDYASAMSRLEP